MADDDVRVPAGWYPDPLGLPQLRWWDNHSWTEHTSDAREPMVAQQVRTAQPAPSAPRLAYADDLPYADDLADVPKTAYVIDDSISAADVLQPVTGASDLPSRRSLREAERLAHGDDVVQDFTGDSPRYADPVGQLAGPVRFGDMVEAESPAARYARAARIDDAPRSMRYDLDERYEDLLGEPTDPRSAFAHASSTTSQFVPDGPAAAEFPPLRWDTSVAEETTERVVRTRTATQHTPTTTTAAAWLLTLLPIYMLLVGMVVLLGGTDATFAPITIGLVAGVPWLAGLIMAIVDRRTLLREGMDRPAHWLWAVLGAPVYLLARLVATVREAGNGFGPVLTYLVLGLVMVGAVVAVPGLAMELAPASFSAEAERSVTADALALGAHLTVDCPETPPLLVQGSFDCQATDASGREFSVRVVLQRSNGWIDWHVDNWGVVSL